MVGEYNEDEEHPQARGGDREEIDRDEVADMIGQERSPGLRGPWRPPPDQPRDGTLGHVDPQLEEFAVDAGRSCPSPKRDPTRLNTADVRATGLRIARGGRTQGSEGRVAGGWSRQADHGLIVSKCPVFGTRVLPPAPANRG